VPIKNGSDFESRDKWRVSRSCRPVLRRQIAKASHALRSQVIQQPTQILASDRHEVIGKSDLEFGIAIRASKPRARKLRPRQRPTLAAPLADDEAGAARLSGDTGGNRGLGGAALSDFFVQRLHTAMRWRWDCFLAQPVAA